MDQQINTRVNLLIVIASCVAIAAICQVAHLFHLADAARQSAAETAPQYTSELDAYKDGYQTGWNEHYDMLESEGRLISAYEDTLTPFVPVDPFN